MKHLYELFLKSKRGNFATMFAVGLVPLFAGAALMVDYSMVNKRQTELQGAVDAAVLMAGAHYRDEGSLPPNDHVSAMLSANFEDGEVRIAQFLIREDDELYLQAEIETDTFLFDQLNRSFVQQSADATVPVGGAGAPLEIAMVLDTTYSMSTDGKLRDLKREATKFLDETFALIPEDKPELLKVAIVPFDQHVNVGTNKRGSSWLRVQPDRSREICYNRRDVISTSNCRVVTSTYDGVTTQYRSCDAEYGPSRRVCRTNNYRWRGCVGSRSRPNHLTDGNYVAEKITGIVGVYCSRAITPLTSSRHALANAVRRLYVSRQTYAATGVMWGIRVLSPDQPFPEGSSFGVVEKAMVIMTDGDNTISRHTQSRIVQNNLRDGATADDDTLEACAVARDKGIKIYTIAFGTEISDRGKRIMQACAGSPERYFEARDGAELGKAFGLIRGNLVQFRLSS